MAIRGVGVVATSAIGATVRSAVTGVAGPSKQVGRVAFLTPEFLTERASSGGVANYVAKMALSLTAEGIEVEVFVPSTRDETIDHEGVLVHRVAKSRFVPARLVVRLATRLVGPRGEMPLELLNARRLAETLDRRHRTMPFDVVQSSNHQVTGAFVRKLEGRRHIVRISTSRRLYDADRGRVQRIVADWAERFDVRVMARADGVYAPSAFLAGYFARRYGLRVEVVRPPAALGADIAPVPPSGLPDRYLIHFGSLGPRKGTDAVASALPLAWREEPDLRMVWVGSLASAAWARHRSAWGAISDRVTWTGPLAKPVLYRAIVDSAGSVLPSTVDNLPNTVIESLTLGVPVIGSDGASIDELVEDGASGRLVPIDDERALARAMVAAWRREAPWHEGGFRRPKVLDEMAAHTAVDRFLRYLDVVS